MRLGELRVDLDGVREFNLGLAILAFLKVRRSLIEVFLLYDLRIARTPRQRASEDGNAQPSAPALKKPLLESHSRCASHLVGSRAGCTCVPGANQCSPVPVMQSLQLGALCRSPAI